MVIDFQMEAAKRRENPRKLNGTQSDRASNNLYEKHPQAKDRIWPAADYGSGWYHAEALSSAGSIQSHRDFD